MLACRVLLLALIAGTALPAVAQNGTANGNQQLRLTLGDLDATGPWIYDDLKAGFSEAKKTGKPLLVVFRCVP
jgi:hypothetical protein